MEIVVTAVVETVATVEEAEVAEVVVAVEEVQVIEVEVAVGVVMATEGEVEGVRAIEEVQAVVAVETRCQPKSRHRPRTDKDLVNYIRNFNLENDI